MIFFKKTLIILFLSKFSNSCDDDSNVRNTCEYYVDLAESDFEFNPNYFFFCAVNNAYIYSKNNARDLYKISDTIIYYQRNSKLFDIPFEANASLQLTILILSNNHIESIANFSFFQSNLEIAVFNNNPIEEVFVYAFLKCTNLKLLSLINTKLKTIDLHFYFTKTYSIRFYFHINPYLTNASFLIDSTMKFSRIFYEFGNSTFFQRPKLTFKRCQHTEVIYKYMKCKILLKETCINNKSELENYPICSDETFHFNFPNLSLNLSNKKFKMHPILKYMWYVVKVNLSHNQIQVLGNEVLPLNIETIDLSFNNLKLVVKNCFRNLEKLKYVNLSNNNLMLLDKMMLFSFQIKLINLMHCQMKILSEIKFKSNEPASNVSIYLDYNDLQKMPYISGDVKSINVLSMTYQKEFKHLNLNFKNKSPTSLVYIDFVDFSHNNLSEFSMDLFCKLKKTTSNELEIRRLDLRFNFLDSLWMQCLLGIQFPNETIFQVFNFDNFFDRNFSYEECSNNKDFDCETIEKRSFKIFQKQVELKIFDTFLIFFFVFYLIYSLFVLITLKRS